VSQPQPNPGQQAGHHSHAPEQGKSALGLMGLISLVLGVVFLIGRTLVAPENMDLATEIEQKRDLFLKAAGLFLAIQGGALLILHATRNPHFATGAGGELDERLADASLGMRLVRAPQVLFAHRRFRELLNVAIQVILAVSLLGLSSYVLARHELFRVDLTSEGLYSLSDESRIRIEGITSAQIRIVTVLPDARTQQGIREVRELIEQYTSVNPRIESHEFDPLAWKDPAERAAELERLGIEGDTSNAALWGLIVQRGKREGDVFQVEKSRRVAATDLWREEIGRRPSDRSRVFLGEQVITTAILQVIDDRKPVVQFLSGHGERGIGAMDGRGLSYLVERLRERGFEVKDLNLLEEDFEVPETCDVLVVADPRSPLSEREVQAIEAYLKRGGELIYLGDVQAERDPETGEPSWLDLGLEEVLRNDYGILLEDWLVALPFQVKDTGENKLAVLLEHFVGYGKRHPITAPFLRETRRFALLQARAVRRVPALGAQAEELIETEREKGKYFRGFGNPFDPRDSSHRPGPFALAIASERTLGKEQDAPRSRVIVVGDADCFANELLSKRVYTNLTLFLNSLNWCLERERQLVGKAKHKGKHRLDMTDEQARRLKLLAFPGLPILAIALGILAWAIRRR